MKTANFNQKNTKYIPTRYFLSRHLGHLKPPRTFLTRHLFIDGHLLPSGMYTINIVDLYCVAGYRADEVKLEPTKAYNNSQVKTISQ